MSLDVARLKQLLQPKIIAAAVIGIAALVGVAFLIWSAARVQNHASVSTIVNGATNVSVTRDIVIAFSHADADEDEIKNHFEIFPAVAGDLMFDGQNITLTHEKNLEYGRQYEVRVNKGVMISHATPLPEDYVVMFTTQQDPSQWFTSPLSYSGFNSYTINAYDAKPAVSMSYYGSSATYRIQLYRSSSEQYIKAAMDLESTYGDQIKSVDYTTYHDGNVIDEQKIVINGGATYYPNITEEGVYLAKVTLDNGGTETYPTHIFLVYTKVAQKTYRLGDQIVSRVIDQRTGVGVKGATVTAISKDGKILFTQKTDSDGLTQHVLAQDEKTEKPALIKIDAGQSFAYTKPHLSSDSYYQTAEHRGYVFTDRPLYTPGDTVHYKAVVWPGESTARPHAGTEVTITVRPAGYGNSPAAIYEKKLKTNGNGTLADSFKLTKELESGGYSITVNDGKKDLHSTDFSVEYYQKPDFQVNTHLAKKAYIRGQKIKVTVSPKYYFGGAVTEGTVDVVLANWGEVVGNHVTADLVNGVATVEVPTKDISMGGWWGTSVFVDATVIEPNGRRTTESTAVELHRGEYEITQTAPVSSWYLSGSQEHAFKYTAKHPDGSPEVGRQLTMTVQKDPWSGDDATRKKNTITYAQKTDPNGEISRSIKFPGGGYYYLKVEGTDSMGNELYASTYVWVTADGSSSDSADASSKVFISFDKKEYNIGETARVSLELPLTSGDLFWSVNKKQFEKIKVQKITDKRVEIEVPITEKLIPGFYFFADVFHDGAFVSDIQSVAVSGKKLTVTLSAPGEATRPGERVSVGVYTTDEEGLPVAAETSVSVVDKSLLALKSDQSGSIHQALYPMDSDWLRTYDSLPPIGSGSGAEMGCFTGDTMILMAGGGLKQIKDVRAGDMIMTHPSGFSAELRTDRVVRTFVHQVDSYLVINSVLNVTAEHRIFVNGEWKQIGDARIGDWMIDAQGNRVAIRSIETRSGTFTVYNLQTEKYHTFIANGVYVHNDKGGGGESAAKRSNFVDTAYWNAFVTTDEAGNGVVTFTLPDNTTTWGVSSKGVSEQGLVGDAKTEFLTTKSVVARLVVPQFVRAGDTIAIMGSVHNATDSDRTFKTLLTAAGATVKDTTTKNVTVKKGNDGVLSWQLVVGQGTELKLSLSAVGGDQQDAIEIKVPVYEPHTQISSAYSGNEPGTHTFDLVSNSEMARAQGKIVIAPSVAAVLPEVIAKLAGFPYGCVEQTMSRHLPNILAYRYSKLGITVDKTKLLDSLNEGFDRLAKMQHDDGGFGWWETDANNVWMSGYVLEGLIEAKQAGLLGTREAMYTRLLQYLKQNVAKMKQDEQAYIAYALAKAEPGSSKQLTDTLIKDAKLDIQSVGYLALASHHNGDADQARGLVRSIKTAIKDNHWELEGDGDYHGALKDRYSATGVSLLAITTIESDDAIEKGAIQWLMQHRTGYDGLWGSTRQSSQILYGLVTYLQNSKELSPSYAYTVSLNGKSLKSGKISSVKDSVTIPFTSQMLQDKNTLVITKFGGGNIYWSVQTTEYLNADALSQVKNDMPIVREYLDASGKPKTSFAQGEMVRVRLVFTAPRVDSRYVMIEDYLPAALQPYNAAFDNAGSSQNDRWWWYDEMDIRDHKVAVFRSYVSSGQNTIEYDARVMFRGSFAAPAPTATFMYEPEMIGFGVPSSITVH